MAAGAVEISGAAGRSRFYRFDRFAV